MGTVTLVAGSPGVGKTTLGLHFAAEGARAGKPVLYLGFMESPAQLREKARSYGMDLGAAESAGQLRFMVLRGHDLEADEIAAAMVEDVERRGVRRLVIDSVAELERGVGFPGRVPGFLSALVGYLRGRDVTSCLTLDMPVVAGTQVELGATPLSVLAENLLLLRQVESPGLHRTFAVFKMRFSGYDAATHQFSITPGQGIRIVGEGP